MEWTKQKTLQLIELYKLQPTLWDPNNRDYKNINKRNAALFEISQHLNSNKDEIDRKLKNLQGQFAREIRKIQESKSNEETYESRWFGFHPLSFLKIRSRLLTRSTRGNNVSEVTVGNELIVDSPVLSPQSSDFQSTSDVEHFMAEKRQFSFDESEFQSEYVDNTPKRMNFMTSADNELDADIIAGKKYTCDLKGISTYQRILCEKIVNDAIYYAKLGKLTEESSIINLKTTNETEDESSDALTRDNVIDIL